MLTEVTEEDEDNILYELLIHTEWSLDPEFVVRSLFLND